ncbi:unnamed protein product, partial [Amoebophrya sp. A25]
ASTWSIRRESCLSSSFIRVSRISSSCGCGGRFFSSGVSERTGEKGHLRANSGRVDRVWGSKPIKRRRSSRYYSMLRGG